jgi:hypothetical protein
MGSSGNGVCIRVVVEQRTNDVEEVACTFKRTCLGWPRHLSTPPATATTSGTKMQATTDDGRM